MPFSISERQTLLAVKGVGPTVVARLEQMGIENLAHLAKANALDIVSNAAKLLGSTCWKNSPQARAAIQGAIDAAQALTAAPGVAPKAVASPLAVAKPAKRPAIKTALHKTPKSKAK
jgi:predicted RecB family nuclease